MRVKSLVLIFVALGCGLVASVGISQLLNRGSANASAALETEQILVTITDIDINSKIDAHNVKIEEWPKAKVPEGALRKLEEAQDKFARVRLIKGFPIAASNLADSNSGLASITIPDGYRVMPVKVEEDTVMKGISPGDRVDVLVFVRKSEEISQTKTYTILRAARVFAVGSNTERGFDEKTSQEQSFRTVSLLLKPEQGEELVVAMQIGVISLALRGPKDESTDNSDGVTSITDILKGGPKVETPAAPPTMPVAAGPSFLDMLKQAKELVKDIKPVLPPAQPTPPSDEAKPFVMIVAGPAEIRQYEWRDPASAPTESLIYSATGGLPPQPAAGAPALPAPLPPAATPPPAPKPSLPASGVTH